MKRGSEKLKPLWSRGGGKREGEREGKIRERHCAEVGKLRRQSEGGREEKSTGWKKNVAKFLKTERKKKKTEASSGINDRAEGENSSQHSAAALRPATG